MVGQGLRRLTIDLYQTYLDADRPLSLERLASWLRGRTDAYVSRESIRRWLIQARIERTSCGSPSLERRIGSDVVASSLSRISRGESSFSAEARRLGTDRKTLRRKLALTGGVL